jgi:superfamily II DNA/RNA helicase
MVNKNQRQNLMFSATFSAEVKKIASSFMNEYYFVTTNNEYSANENIEQTLIQTSTYDEKISNLHQILQQVNGSIISNLLLIKFSSILRKVLIIFKTSCMNQDTTAFQFMVIRANFCDKKLSDNFQLVKYLS